MNGCLTNNITAVNHLNHGITCLCGSENTVFNTSERRIFNLNNCFCGNFCSCARRTYTYSGYFGGCIYSNIIIIRGQRSTLKYI